MSHASMFAAALLCAQLVTGTNIYFASCVFLYVLLSVYAFNVSGGLYRASGVFVFFNSVLGLILSQCVKAILLEPADSNLHKPNLTITVYLVGAIAMALAAVVNQRIRPPKSLTESSEDFLNLRQMAIGCFVMGVGLPLLIGAFATTTENGSVASALGMLNFFLPLSVVLSTYNVIKVSHGKRSVDGLVILILAYSTFLGIFNATKQGAFAPLVGYILTCAALRYRFRLVQVAMLAGGLAAGSVFLFPFIQVAKVAITEATSFRDQLNIEVALASNPSQTYASYEEGISSYIEDSPIHYYNVDTKLIERFSLISISSYLIEYTDRGHVLGWHPMLESVESVIPHFIWANKPQNNLGTGMARNLGILGEDDYTTGVSFNMFSEAYAFSGLMGVLVGVALFLTPFFFGFDSLVGDPRQSPWALVVFIFFAHAGPEIGLTGLFPDALVTTLKIWVTIMLVRHVLPPLANLFTGPGELRLARARSGRPIKGRAGLRPPAESPALSPAGD